MLYLLDANVLIDANRDYYPIGRVDEYWDWLIYQGRQGQIKVPLEIYEEIKDGKKGEDLLATWAKEPDTETALKLAEDADIDLVRQVTHEGYGSDLTDIEIERIGRDPFLIAYGLVAPHSRKIVTTEVSKPSKKRANRKIPDICDHFGIDHCNPFHMVKELDFSTSWNR